MATSANTLATWIARWKDGVKERDGDEGENEKERRERVERQEPMVSQMQSQAV